jgi:hypothetical protein
MLPRTLTIPALHNVLRGGTASVPEITGELLARATARSDLHAFITVADEIPETGHTDAQPLSGVPLAIKDNINTGDALLGELGFERADVAGHDRGGRVAHATGTPSPRMRSTSTSAPSPGQERCGAASTTTAPT